MTRPFGGGAYFNHSLALVLFNRLVTIITTAVGLLATGGWADAQPAAPLASYFCVSLANVIATTCQYEALKYVSFAAQTITKCLKPAPVLAWGVLVLGRPYTRGQVALAAAVVVGSCMFVLEDAPSGRVNAHARQPATTLTGGALMAAYLAADGLTSTLQDRIFDRASVTPANQVLYVSLFSCAASLVGLAFGRDGGGLGAAVQFCVDHRDAGVWIAALALAATSSSLAISTTIQRCGALILSLAMTVRQLGSVLVSKATYGDSLTPTQAAGIALVFGSLLWRGWRRVHASPQTHNVVASPCRHASPSAGRGKRVAATP